MDPLPVSARPPAPAHSKALASPRWAWVKQGIPRADGVRLDRVFAERVPAEYGGTASAGPEQGLVLHAESSPTWLEQWTSR
mmetsp:Transcript_76722/g.204873  ORF Transcript_76722/g.204873 Transcript_76722/m.204873 type:complete len:81 (-) Transcript_76722:912-1154(-)